MSANGSDEQQLDTMRSNIILCSWPEMVDKLSIEPESRPNYLYRYQTICARQILYVAFNIVIVQYLYDFATIE